ncbi:hypothetical protein BDZ91DRAFT_768540 [Kalaharituber pfeilii]|nr:hypothetical protein BDZ91DRAFT_768540 [Kalaharituber pfeilii]
MEDKWGNTGKEAWHYFLIPEKKKKNLGIRYGKQHKMGRRKSYYSDSSEARKSKERRIKAKAKKKSLAAKAIKHGEDFVEWERLTGNTVPKVTGSTLGKKLKVDIEKCDGSSKWRKAEEFDGWGQKMMLYQTMLGETPWGKEGFKSLGFWLEKEPRLRWEATLETKNQGAQ